MSKKYNRWRRKRKGSATGPEERAPSPITEIDLGEQQVIEPQENDFEKLKSRLQSRGTFNSDDLPVLQNFLIAGQLSNEWLNIGIQLRVDTERLKNIRQNFQNNEEALREMLILCLKHPLTWDTIVSAIKSPAVGGRRLFETEGDQEEVRSKNIRPLNMQVRRTGSQDTSRSSLSSITSLQTTPLDEVESQSTPSPAGDVTPCPMENQRFLESLHSGYEKLPIYTSKERVDHTFKVVIVGDVGVGKTSLIDRFIRARVYEPPDPTIGHQGEHTRVIKMPNGQTVKLRIWDTAGQERSFRGIPHVFFRNADVALITFDLSEKRTFERATKDVSEKYGDFTSWVKETRLRLDDSRFTMIILVGNKNDIKHRKVSYKEADHYAGLNGMKYIETSSKEDNNVDQLFFLVCHSLVEGPSRAPSSYFNLDAKPPPITPTWTLTPAPKKSSCCLK